MLVKIANQARNYAWGSRTLISDYFGLPATNEPMAEIWFGTHPGSPAVISDQPERTLSQHLDGHKLPFLLKILAAEQPLSIQAHPNSSQALIGFELENKSGIEITNPSRNYKDEIHKPELVVALSDFEALFGFKSINEIENLLKDIESHTETSMGLKGLCQIWYSMLTDSNGIQKLFSDIAHRRGNFDGVAAELTTMADFDSRFALAAKLNGLYPGDPGVLLALFMNHVYLNPGDALFLPAGIIHAYLSGLGIELMSASDNVLRGGLTTKHIDVDELEKIVNFSPTESKLVEQKKLTTGLIQYICDTEDFLIYKLEPNARLILADLTLPGEAIFLCTSGEVAVSNSQDEQLVLRRGEAAYMSGDAKMFSISGSGTAFLAASGK